MFCQKCGTNNEDNATNCSNCDAPLEAAPESTPAPTSRASIPEGAKDIPNYLVQSILVTLLCCLPFGIASIVFAAQVNGKAEAGDIQGALEASKKAKKFVWLSFWLGILVYVFTIIIEAAIIIPAIASEISGS